jgi:hypothetical protein
LKIEQGKERKYEKRRKKLGKRRKKVQRKSE